MPACVVLRAPRLIDGLGNPAVENAALVIVGGKIVAAGAASTIDVPTGDGVVIHDYPDCTLLPGLIDSHTHLTFSANDSALEDAIGDSDEAMTLRAAANAQAELRCGVTTIRDCGGRGYLTLALRDSILSGVTIGPRILASAMPITTTGGHLNFCGLEADGVPEVVKATRRLCKAGVDFIKVMATGGGMTPGTNSRAPQYTVEELAAIVAEATRLGGRHVGAHCHATAGISNAVEAGITTIEHCSWLGPVEGHEFDPRVVARMVEKGTYVCLTMGSERAAVKDANQLTEGQQRAVASWDEHFDLLRRTIRGGVRFIASSDAGVSRTYFGEYPLTLEVMVSLLDIAPLETIHATTGRAAEAIGIAGLVGALTAGRRGDVLLVEGDPLVDIRAMRRTRAVYRDGALLVEDGKLV